MPTPARPKLYHITPIANLASMATSGLRSDAVMAVHGGPATSIGMTKLKSRRFTLPVSCHPGDVPFYFCPRSPMLYMISATHWPRVERVTWERVSAIGVSSRAARAQVEAALTDATHASWGEVLLLSSSVRSRPTSARTNRRASAAMCGLVTPTQADRNPKWIINFPTKRHWRNKSRVEDIDAGLVALVDEIRRLEIRSIAIPPLGCGLGGRARRYRESHARGRAGESLKLDHVKGPYGPYAQDLRHVLHRVEGHFSSGYADGGDDPTKQLELLPGAYSAATAVLATRPETLLRFRRVVDLVDGLE